MSKKQRLRPLGQITDDLEDLLQEMTDDHELQWGEVLGLVHTWLSIHASHSQEKYLDNTSPVYYYGSKED